MISLGKKEDKQAIFGEYVLCKLMVPKNNEKTPAAAELFFAALHGVYSNTTKVQATMSFEIVSINKFIQFYFYVPRYLKEFVEGQFYAQYPNVEIHEAEDYATKTLENKLILGADLQTTKKEVYPIKTFQSFEVDPLSGITSVLSQLNSEDELWIQICVEPVDDIWQKKSISYIKAIQEGRDPSESVAKAIFKSFGSILSQTTKPPETASTSVEPRANVSGSVQTAMKGVEEKAAKLGFYTKIRINSLSTDQVKAQQTLNSAIGAFKQFNIVNMNGFMQGKAFFGEEALNLYKSRELGVNPYIFNIEELASIYHLPTETVETPSMDYAGSRKGEPPQNLPLQGIIPDDELSLIGKTNFRGVEKTYGIKMLDRALHMYAIGKTGTGKSTLLKNMIIDDIFKGRGLAVVDPHGDLVNDVLEYIPEDRIEDVIYFSPADRDFPVGFNLMESVDPEYKNIVASGIVGVFKKIFGESWGPRLEYILRNVVLGLLDYPDATLLSVLKVLTDTRFRREVVEKITDPVIRDFFVNEFEKYDQKFRTEAVAPIQNKVGQFLSSTVIRNIVGQKHTTIDLRKAMDEKKILLVDLSIGKIGEDNSALLGSLMITKIQMAAMSRADMDREKRVPFYLYVDEFQNFATDSFAVILSEARKYGLSLMVTNQYIAQMPENVANAVFGNVGTLITFRVGAGDAEFLNREFVPVFEPADLTNLNNYNIYLKMAIDGVTSIPFSSKTMLTEHEPTGTKSRVMDLSRQKYSKPRTDVEQEVISNTTSTVMPSDVVPSMSTSNYNTGSMSTPATPTPTPTVPTAATPTDRNAPGVEAPAPTSAYAELDAEQALPEKSPEDITNAKTAEDYNLNNWYFLTRTGFKKATGREDIEDEGDDSAKDDDEQGTDKKEKPKESFDGAQDVSAETEVKKFESKIGENKTEKAATAEVNQPAETEIEKETETGESKTQEASNEISTKESFDGSAHSADSGRANSPQAAQAFDSEAQARGDASGEAEEKIEPIASIDTLGSGTIKPAQSEEILEIKPME